MGMKNNGTITGVGTGELSEAVFALALLGKAHDTDMWWAFDNIDTLINDGLLVIDGKTDEALAELDAFSRGTWSATTFEVCKATASFVNGYDFPAFDEVRNLGASGKDDIALYLDGVRVQGFSLKWKHDNAYRQQSVAWDSINALYGMFVDMDDARYEWESVVPTFTTPARRNSSAKGDWSPALRKQGDAMLDAYADIVWGEMVYRMENDLDPTRLAKGMVSLYTGLEDNITFVELSEGVAFDINSRHVKRLAKRLTDLTFERKDSDAGRTRRLIVKAAGRKVMQFTLTASANAGDKVDRDIRIIKPQCYVEVSI